MKSAIAIAVILLLPFAGTDAQICVVGTNAALSFDGASQWAHVPHNAAFDGLQDFTVECWFRIDPNANLNNFALVCLGGATNGEIAFNLYVAGHNVAFASHSSISGSMYTMNIQSWSANVHDGAWHHVALTRLASAGVSLYVDGVYQGGGLAGLPLPLSISDLSFGVMLGDDNLPGPGASSGYMHGQIDEVRFWNVGHTPSQLLLLKDAGIIGNDPGLIGYWRFDENVGQVLHDSSPTGADGLRGLTISAEGSDPSWTTISVAPIAYCMGSGVGQANAAGSSLVINGVGAGTSPGPFFVQIPSAGTLSFSWTAPPGQPLILISGPLNAGAAFVPGFGSIDIGTPPQFADVTVLVDPYSPWSPFFTANASGAAAQSFSLPSMQPGLLGAFQGAVFDPAALFGVVLTASFQVVVL